VFSKTEFNRGAAEVTFTDIAGGLVAKGTTLTGFELAGTNRVFHAADARIDGAKVVVSASAVTSPVAVRYAWGNAPEAALANSEGLPAAPFRSDNW
jgi:sialate O-acetylesterase